MNSVRVNNITDCKFNIIKCRFCMSLMAATQIMLQTTYLLSTCQTHFYLAKPVPCGCLRQTPNKSWYINDGLNFCKRFGERRGQEFCRYSKGRLVSFGGWKKKPPKTKNTVGHKVIQSWGKNCVKLVHLLLSTLRTGKMLLYSSTQPQKQLTRA